ncbi:hypothetical protein P43SY_005137 [Pythium insidiosum]|uniref:Tc1-like transposase DDE domain-containing protein n=1 Tax=Pythium insidiosum TaxID=114742 RepID=A0AAD5LR50_PYTIN|nr:hypothetical protein P43SY_005137 [Pythium insidiosum]
MHVKEQDIFRFVEELDKIIWNHQNLVFLDEVSFDNRGMIRKRGYAIRGKKVAVRGEYDRKPRVSVLAFIGVNGVIDYYNTDGTFDRAESVGVAPIFLPAYCPFFNPIEFLFGYVKRSFMRHYVESRERNLLPFVVQTFRRFQGYDMSKVFAHCGWTVRGVFDPTGPLATENAKEKANEKPNRVNDDVRLGFTDLNA